MDDHINHPIAKGVTTVVAFAVMYSDWIVTAGKLCGAAVSIAIFIEWLWKRVIKPLGYRFGFFKHRIWAPTDY